jgi:hypothetical protein
MSRVLDPFRFVLIAVAGWMNQRQLQAIAYLKEDNRLPERKHDSLMRKRIWAQLAIPTVIR